MPISPMVSVDRLPIIMVDRGNCTFVTKARNVQKIGGGLALIINNEIEEIDRVLMTDDGTASDIFIPTILISKSDGDKLKEFFNSHKDEEKVLSSITLSVEFKMVRTLFK